MFKWIGHSNHSDAGTLLGVRISTGIVGVSAIVAVAGCALFSFVTLMTIMKHDLTGCGKSVFLLLCCLAVTYVLLHICVGLFHGARLAQLGAIAWGVLLLLFCWMIVHDARGPSNPKAPSAHESDGVLLLLLAPTGLWLIGYLSTKRVSAKFLSSRAEE